MERLSDERVAQLADIHPLVGRNPPRPDVAMLAREVQAHRARLAQPEAEREGMERKPIGWLDAELVDPEPSLRMAVEGLLACTLDESGRDGYRSLYAVDRRRLMWLKRGLERFDGLPLTDFSAFAYRAPPGPTTEEE